MLFDGQIRKIKSLTSSRFFYDFEFWGDTDQDTFGLLCLIQRSCPEKLFIIKMTTIECQIAKLDLALEEVRNRACRHTGISDLIYLRIIRTQETKKSNTSNFQSFLKGYKKPLPIYQDIYDNTQEAIQVEYISVEEFKNIGGEIVQVPSN